jgi:hypothetical protein
VSFTLCGYKLIRNEYSGLDTSVFCLSVVSSEWNFCLIGELGKNAWSIRQEDREINPLTLDISQKKPMYILCLEGVRKSKLFCHAMLRILFSQRKVDSRSCAVSRKLLLVTEKKKRFGQIYNVF